MNEPRFADLEDHEVAALDEQQVERWISIECAYEGAPLLPECPEEPRKPEDVQQDQDVWSVAGIDFAREDEAYELLRILQSYESLGEVHGWGDGAYMSPRRREYDVQRRRVLSEHRYNETAELRETYNERLSRYRELRDAYDKAAKAREEVAGYVWRRFHECSGREAERGRFRERFDEYVDLAGGNEHVAYRFLVKAYPDFPKQFPEVNAELDPGPECENAGPEASA